MKISRLFGTLLLLNAALYAQEDSVPAAEDSFARGSFTGENPLHAEGSLSVSGSKEHTEENPSHAAEGVRGTGESMSHAKKSPMRTEEGMSRVEESTPRYELGAIVGEPTGVSVKVWMNGASAIDGAVAWSLANEDFLHLHADLLVHNFKWLHVKNRVVPVFAGVGGVARVAKQKSAKIGLRLPVGVSYMFYYFPLDIFVEAAPILELVPSTSFNFNGGIGLRFMFGKSAS
jgi:hypothetical protein